MQTNATTAAASLPLYRLAELDEPKAVFWQAVATELQRAGCHGLPTVLRSTTSSVPDAVGAETLFTQLCGYPMMKLFSSQVRVLAAPVYDAPLCEGPTHCGVFVVARESSFEGLEDLRGQRFVFGGPMSNSGMNLPRRALAELAGGASFFRRVTETDSQGGNLAAVAAGAAEATCVDNMTFEYVLAYRPQLGARLRVLVTTPRSPSIPFVTSSSTDEGTVARLQEGLSAVASSPEWSAARAGLLLSDIVPAEMADYELLLEYERAAEALGYPVIR